jgi:hypothetical protein
MMIYEKPITMAGFVKRRFQTQRFLISFEAIIIIRELIKFLDNNRAGKLWMI